MIYLFDKSQRLIGFLNEKEELTKAQLTLKINEAATLDLEVPAKPNYLSELENVKYVAVPYPDDNEKLLFLQVMTRTDEQDTVSLMAKEYAFQELSTSGYIEDKRYTDADARTLMNGALSGSGYTLKNVNVSGSATTNFYYIDYLTAISNVIDLLEGEIKFYVTVDGNKISGKYVDYVIARGVNTSKVFAYGSNLISIERQSDASSVYTAILPRGKGEAVSHDDGSPDGYGRRINIADVVWEKPTNKLDKPAGSLVLEDPTATAAFGQANGTARLLLKTYDNIEDKNELINAAYRDLLKTNHPAVQFKATVANIGESGLGDTIVIMHSERSMSYRTRIFQIEYDLIEINNTVATFGENLSKKSITSMVSSVSKTAEKAKEIATNAVVSANGINDNYYGETAPTNPKEGDTWFYTEGETFGIRRYINGQWVEYTNTNTSQKIAEQVDAAISNAKEYSDNLNQKQANATNSLANELTNKANSLSTSQQTIASQAASYTNSAVADANAKATAIGQTTAQNAQKALEEKATTLQQSIDTKVAKTDYDKKTGELTTSVNTAQQTANTATQTIGTYKQTNDRRVSAAETNIKANADAIALTASKTELDEATGELSGSIADLNVKADGITQTVADLQTKVNNLGQANLLNNTDFNPDLEGWTRASSGDAGVPYRSYLQSDINGVVIGFNTTSATTTSYSTFRQTITLASTTGSGNKMSLSWSSFAQRTDNYNNLLVKFYDTNGNEVSTKYTNWADTATGNTWKTRKKWENITIPDTAVSALVSFEAREGTQAYLGQPMAVYGATIGDYVQGNYNNNASLAEVKLTADGLRETVNNPKTGLATRLLTAEGSITKVQDATNNLTAQQTLTANGLTQEVSDRKTGDSNTLQAGKDFTTSQIKSYDTGMQSQIGQMSDGILATVSTTNLVVDSSLMNGIDNWEVLSGDRKWYYSGLTMYKGVASIGINVSDSSGSYNVINSKTISSNSFSGSTMYVSVDVLARSIGTSSTDYLIIYFREQDSNGNTIASTSVTGTLTTTNNNWVNYRKKITLNSNTKSVYINYQLRGNGNVYVSRPYVGTVELPAGGYTPGATNNNTTVLALLKDNWKIGIADNIGLITSGIVGDSNSINLISKNVTIDSPNTQIKGTAWITNAMLGNASVSTANIGDLAVTSAKISELDVNKLSGNITNFIKSYWSNAYQNLQIDANAIDFTATSSRTKIENGALTLWQNAGGYYRLGGLKTLKDTSGGENNHTAGVYLSLDEWQTTKNGDKYWNYGGSDFFGGSEIGFSHSTGIDRNGNPVYGALMKWSNSLAAGRQEGVSKGFNFFDDINFQGHYFLVNGATNKMKLTWVSWSDWGNYHNIALTNETSKAGIAMNDDNLVLFGVGKRADALTGWKA